MKRITVIMPDEVYDKVVALAKKEKRKKSPMAAMLIEDGLKFIGNTEYNVVINPKHFKIKDAYEIDGETLVNKIVSK
jgi:hypothetical protein